VGTALIHSTPPFQAESLLNFWASFLPHPLRSPPAHVGFFSVPWKRKRTHLPFFLSITDIPGRTRLLCLLFFCLIPLLQDPHLKAFPRRLFRSSRQATKKPDRFQAPTSCWPTPLASFCYRLPPSDSSCLPSYPIMLPEPDP